MLSRGAAPDGGHAAGRRPDRCCPGLVDTARRTSVKTESSNDVTRILVVGGGYVGMYTALRLQRKLKQERSRAREITVVDPEPYMTYQPFLPEAAAGSISPRHVVVPLRRVLRQCKDRRRRGAPPSTTTDAPATIATLATQEDGQRRHRAARTTSWSSRRARSRAPCPSPAWPTRHRLQDRRRGHRPAQPRARAARHRLLHPRRRGPRGRAHLRLRRRRLRGRRGARPNWRTWPATPSATTTTSSPRT